jgi:hypothetical protein
MKEAVAVSARDAMKVMVNSGDMEECRVVMIRKIGSSSREVMVVSRDMEECRVVMVSREDTEVNRVVLVDPVDMDGADTENSRVAMVDTDSKDTVARADMVSKADGADIREAMASKVAGVVSKVDGVNVRADMASKVVMAASRVAGAASKVAMAANRAAMVVCRVVMAASRAVMAGRAGWARALMKIMMKIITSRACRAVIVARKKNMNRIMMKMMIMVCRVCRACRANMAVKKKRTKTGTLKKMRMKTNMVAGNTRCRAVRARDLAASVASSRKRKIMTKVKEEAVLRAVDLPACPGNRYAA